MVERVVIVGGGQAAAQAVDVLRRKGFKGTLSIIAAEPCLPYQRPPLSKKYLSGSLERERLAIRPETFYVSHAIDVHLGRRAVEIERASQRLRLDDGTLVSYDALLLATGSVPRPLTVPGAELGGVHFLRTMADSDRIRADCATAQRVVVIGGGYIGLETAAIAREMGKDVTVIEMADRVMNRVTSPQLSAFYAAQHARHGVRICNGEQVRALTGSNGRVRAVLTESALEHPADVVVVGVGVLPADELARAAGLACDNGIVVDEYCRTSDPHIYAAGDCANQPNRHYGRRMRLESVDNAFEQAGTAALNILGQAIVHDKLPWFWSDQYDLKLVIVGVCTGYDTALVRGSPEQGSFSVCYLRDGEFIAIDSVNVPKDQMAARKLIGAHARPDPARLVDAAIALRDVV